MYYLKLFKISLASLRLSFNPMRDLKKSFSVPLSKMFCMVGRPEAERVSLFLLILSAIVITQITVGFFYAVLSMN
jgi:hypothetical protein